MIQPEKNKSFSASVPRNAPCQFRGFTLIETIITISVFTLIFGAASAFVILAYRTHGYTWQQSIAIDEARRGLETMIKEIREVRSGEDGSYPIVYAGDKEFIFFSDINNDGKTERVRYFLETAGSGEETKDCATFSAGGSCRVDFPNFFRGTLTSAQVKVSVDGDFGQKKEYADIYTVGNYKLGTVCESGCVDCRGTWQGTQTYDVKNFVSNKSIYFEADASSDVGSECKPTYYSMKAIFEFSWREDLTGIAHEFKKGVINPVTDSGGKISYPPDQEKITILTSYVRNVPPIFKYFDRNGNELVELPARLKDAKVMEVYLVVNVDPNRPPNEFELKSAVQLRNLKAE